MLFDLIIDHAQEVSARVSPGLWERVAKNRHALADIADMSAIVGITLAFSQGFESCLYLRLEKSSLLQWVQPVINRLIAAAVLETMPTVAIVTKDEDGTIWIDVMLIHKAEEPSLSAAQECRVFATFGLALKWLAETDSRNFG